MHVNWPKLLRRKFTDTFPVWYFIEYMLLRSSMAVMNIFPITVSTWMARRVGDLMFLIMPTRRKIALQNLTIAFGDSKRDSEKRKIILESFRNLITSFMEFFRLPKLMKVSAKHVHFKNMEHIDHAFSRGKGLILVMSHLGVWEYLGFLTHLKKYSGAILGKGIRNFYIYRWIVSLRKMMGLRYIDKDMSPKKIFSELRQGHAVAIAIDQWAGNEGIWVDFFNKPTSTTSIPAELAKRTGAALIPAYCIRIATGEYEIHAEPEAPLMGDENNCIENTTRELNRRLEEKIRAFPEQWTWTHKRWKNKRHIKLRR